jgi:hypothetical protein
MKKRHEVNGLLSFMKENARNEGEEMREEKVDRIKKFPPIKELKL